MRLLLTLTGIAALLALSLAGCSNGSSRVAVAPPGSGDSALAGLPSPASLSLRAASAGGTELSGSQFDPGLPSSNVSAAGSTASFTPQGEPDAIGAIALAVYLMQHSGDPEPVLTLDFADDTFGPTTSVFASVADFDANSWVCIPAAPQPGPDFSLTLPNITFSNPANQTLVAVIVTGPDPAILESVRLGNPSQVPNEPPVAWIDAGLYDVGNRHRSWTWPGKPMRFTMDKSFDRDGYIDHYSVDFGDGKAPRTYLNATRIDREYSFDQPGLYTVTCTAYDNDDDTASDTTEVLCVGPPYGESEPNDTAESGDAISFPLSSLAGRISGSDPSDFYTFTLAFKQWVHAEVRMEGFGELGCSPHMDLCSSDGTVLAASGSWPECTLECEPGSYCLQVYDADGGDHDYSLTACAVDALPQADVTYTLSHTEVPLMVHAEAYPIPFGDAGAAEIRWDIEGDGYWEDGDPNDPMYGIRAVDFPVYDPNAPLLLTTYVKDTNGVVTEVVTELQVVGVSPDIEPNDNLGEAIVWENWSKDPNDPAYREFEEIYGYVGILSPGGSAVDWWKGSVDVEGTLIVHVDCCRSAGYLNIDLLGPDGTTVLDTAQTYYNGHAQLQFDDLQPGEFEISFTGLHKNIFEDAPSTSYRASLQFRENDISGN